MDTINIITTLINNVGFPVATCCVLFYIMFKQNNKIIETLNGIVNVVANITERLKELEEKVDNKDDE